MILCSVDQPDGTSYKTSATDAEGMKFKSRADQSSHNLRLVTALYRQKYFSSDHKHTIKLNMTLK